MRALYLYVKKSTVIDIKEKLRMKYFEKGCKNTYAPKYELIVNNN